MDKTEFAKMLDGRQYLHEITQGETDIAKENNLVIVFGASDDLMKLNGVFADEINCYDGGSVLIEPDGGIISQTECEDCSQCKFQIAAKAKAHELKALWCENDKGASWTYEIDIPFATFNIMEDAELYCVGIVFSLDDVKVPPVKGE